VAGVTGVTGLLAQQIVVEEHNLEQESAITLNLNMEERDVKGTLQKRGSAMKIHVQVFEMNKRLIKFPNYVHVINHLVR
jgi:hypothetical protein